jgi:hypothetical protein
VQVLVVVEVEAIHQLERGFRPCHLGDGHGPVQLDHRRVGRGLAVSTPSDAFMQAHGVGGNTNGVPVVTRARESSARRRRDVASSRAGDSGDRPPPRAAHEEFVNNPEAFLGTREVYIEPGNWRWPQKAYYRLVPATDQNRASLVTTG